MTTQTKSPTWDDAPDIDHDYSLCTDDGEDCIYIGAERWEGDGKFWAYVSIDVDSASYCEGVEIAGPFDTYIDAVHYALNVADQIADGWAMAGGPNTLSDYDTQRDAVADAASLDGRFI